MRILKVTQVYHPFLDKGGPAFKVRAIAEGLAQRGHQVTVLTTAYGPPPLQSNGRVEVIYLRPLITYRATTVNPGAFSFCRKRLRDFDVAHIYGLYDTLGPVVGSFCRRRSLPYLVEPLGMVRPIDRSFRLKRLWHALVRPRYLQAAALLVATSEQERDELLADGFPGHRVVVRYNGVDPAEFQLTGAPGEFRRRWGFPADEPLCLFLGRVIPRKGADLLIEAFAEALPHHGRLVIAGPEGERGYLDHLRALAASCGVANRVHFPGPLFGQDKKEALLDADVFALPSRYENFGNAAAEALACGTPVIVTDRCGISQLVRNQAGLVIPRERQALVEALREIVCNAPRSRDLRQNCLRVAQRLRWDVLVEQMEQHYARVTSR